MTSCALACNSPFHIQTNPRLEELLAISTDYKVALLQVETHKSPTGNARV